MHIVLLSGGSGKRLWPLSNEARAKQFLKIFRNNQGVPESMVQRMYRMIKSVAPDASITIATSQNQVVSIHNQLGADVSISIEPCRRDTFPAIALATAYLHDVKGVSEEEVVVVCPVDPYVEKPYFEMLKELASEAAKGEANLILMGIKPTYPSAKYGYIFPDGKFKEKPTAEIAAEYITRGALWNGGIFAYKLKYVLGKAQELCGTCEYKKLYDNYENLEKISFDYAVAEYETSIKTLEFAGEWKDLGTWNTFTEAMSEAYGGDVITGEGCENVHIVNELNIPLVALGLKNVAIVACPDGILVSDKHGSSELKKYVENIDMRPMYEKREWGEYTVLDYVKQDNGTNSLTKHLTIKPGKHLSYQKHFRRDEIWTIVDGEGDLYLDDAVRHVSRGDVAYIRRGMKHSIKGLTELHFIEVQIGDELIEEDIEHFEWCWGE